MANDNEDFEAMAERYIRILQAALDQDEAELREKYLALEPRDREGLKNIVATLEEVAGLFPRVRFFDAFVLLAIRSFQVGRPPVCIFRLFGLGSQLKEWDEASAAS